MRFPVVCIIFILALGIGPASADPAQEASELLIRRGIMQGYTDGSFRGERAITRNELAKTVNLLEEALEEQHQKLATKKELSAARAEVRDLEQRQEALHQRVRALEETTDRDRARSDEFWF